ncbi:MAG: ATP-binding protein, partial [Lentimicrobiaceae bacterium]|nr:ATP-binding protein [Lentimicrobiaceae bacterium]
GKGTNIQAIFGLSNIDRPSPGDIGGTLAMLISSNPEIRFVYSHTTASGLFKLDTREVHEMLDGMSITAAPVYNFLKAMINENLTEIQFS